jgi:hypothetical protein
MLQVWQTLHSSSICCFAPVVWQQFVLLLQFTCMARCAAPSSSDQTQQHRHAYGQSHSVLLKLFAKKAVSWVTLLQTVLPKHTHHNSPALLHARISQLTACFARCNISRAHTGAITLSVTTHYW